MTTVINSLILSVLFCYMKLSSCSVINDCASIGCVHASAQLIRRINNETDPCDDFYEFACGTFIKNTHTPDEKLSINTESVLIDELDGNLFRILSSPVKKKEIKPHQTAKNVYKTCMDQENLNKVANDELIELLKSLGGWPVLMKDKWNENDFSWERTLMKLHEFTGIVESEDIFRMNFPMKIQKIAGSKTDKTELDDDESTLTELYSEFMVDMAVMLGADDNNETRKELFDALELGIALNQLLVGKNFKNQSNVRNAKDLQIELDMIKWFELFDRFKLEKVESFIVNKDVHVYDNLKRLKEIFKPKDFANYLLWRIVDFSSLFLHEAAVSHVLKLNKKVYGLLDKEQRWKFCTRMANKYAELAAGSLYVKEYFSDESRRSALELSDQLIQEFKTTIKAADWMDEDTKSNALNQLNTLKVYMGYDERLLDDKEVEKYYGKERKDFSHSFLYLALQLNVQKTDKKFKHKFRNMPDWTEYAKPTSSKASYNSRDHTIYFAAAFLQPPNFDRNRPMSMNFGAIGSIIAHELTHCLDRYLEKLEADAKEAYESKTDCIIRQNSRFIDTDINQTMNGNVTVKEDTADNGGVNLAYRAYKKYLESNDSPEYTLIALDYTPAKLFWISYAQFYCSVQREQLKRILFESKEVHSFDKFRVWGPLMNSRDFAHDFECPTVSTMNPDYQKCIVW